MLKIKTESKLLHFQENLWPNPSETFINVKTSAQASVQDVKILNTTGQLIWLGKLAPTQTEFTIPLEEIQPGVYHFVISNPQGVFSKSFLKN